MAEMSSIAYAWEFSNAWEQLGLPVMRVKLYGEELKRRTEWEEEC